MRKGGQRMGWHIFGIIVGIVIYSIYRYSQEDCNEEGDEGETNNTLKANENEHNQIEQRIMEEKPRTKELAMNMLAKMGAEPKEKEEGRIQFEYQGVLFLMDADDECPFVYLIWPWCHSFSKYDIDEFARVRQVVNDINMRGSVIIFYSITDSDEVAVHIKKHFLLVPQIPHLEEYLKLMVNSFFGTARTLGVEIEKMRIQECIS